MCCTVGYDCHILLSLYLHTFIGWSRHAIGRWCVVWEKGGGGGESFFQDQRIRSCPKTVHDFVLNNSLELLELCEFMVVLSQSSVEIKIASE